MAVKQYLNENNQRSDNLKWNIAIILEYIDDLEINVAVNGSQLEHDWLQICNKMVYNLGKRTF